MNAVEIEEAVSALAEQPFDAEEFAYAFLAAFGNGVRQGSCRLHSNSRCAIGWAGHGAAAASFMGERVGGPMASAPGVGSFWVEPDRADGVPVARLA